MSKSDTTEELCGEKQLIDELPEIEPTVRDTMDSIQFITKYINTTDVPLIADKQEREEQIHKWITLYHDDTLLMKERYQYRDYVIFNVFYLYPYILSRRRLRFSLFDEAIQQLVISTITAIEKYNYKEYTRFISYLAKYIVESINICMQNDYIVTIPTSARKRLLKDYWAQVAEDRLNGVATNDCTKDKDFYTPVSHEYSPTKQILRYYQNIENIENIEQLGPPVAGEPLKTDEVYSTVERAEYLRILEFAISENSDILTDKERLVITYRFGIFGAPKLTLKQVTEMFHAQGWRATVEWIFQLEKRATSKLLRFMKRCGLDEGLATC